MKHFTKVLKYLDSIRYINNGGCGVAALAIYRWLEKNNMLRDTKIVFLYDYGTHHLYKHNYDILKNNKNDIPEGAPHIVIKRLNKYLDSEGVLSNKYINFHYCDKLEVDAEFLLTAVNNNLDMWCRLFNRKEYLPKISRKLKIDLSDVVHVN
jgi:hypothetical protein